jgi:RNA polymerase sigma-70 factor (ECF subfamily)
MTYIPPLSNEDELVTSAQRGALEAFSALYEHYLPIVYNRVRCTVPEEDAEDVTQDIFLSTIRSLKGFRGEARFGTWLRTITSRQIAEYYRHKHQPSVPLSETLQAPHDPAVSDEAIQLRQAFRKLSQKHREILLLRFADAMPFHEIARLQGSSLEATKSLFRRAVAALHKQVSRHG